MPDQLDTNASTSIAPEPAKPGEIRVMPERFLTHHETSGSTRRHWWVYLVVAIAAVGLIGAGIYLLNRMVGTNNNNTPTNQNVNNAPVNENTNNSNANLDNTNENTNTAVVIKELADTLLRKSDLGEDFATYEESKITTDSTNISGITLARAQRVFTFEDTKRSSISITIRAMEATSKTEANSAFQFENNRLKRSVGNQEGRFVKATTVGDQSLQYERTDSSKTEALFSWKYLVADITIDVFKGSGLSADNLKTWLNQLLQNFKEYDSTRPITNTNDNSNANLNANANVNQNTNGTISATPPPSSEDTDQDGLTDTEELLYKTGVDKPDTDGDSYLDGPELASGFSPIAAAGARLEASGLVKVYSSQSYDYRLLYPSSWIVQNAVADGSSIALTSETGEFVGVTIEENPDHLSARQWYIDQSPGLDASKITDVVVGDLTGVKSSDGLTVYLSHDTAIYVLAYNLANRETANFLTTFDMMVRSFRLTGTTPLTNSNSNANVNSNSNSNGNSNTANRSDGTSTEPSGIATPAPVLNSSNGLEY